MSDSTKIADYDTFETLRALETKLRGLLDSIELAGEGEHGSTIRDVARISVALTTVCAELRQHSKAAIREVSRIPWDTLVAFLKSLPRERQEDLANVLLRTDAEDSLL